MITIFIFNAVLFLNLFFERSVRVMIVKADPLWAPFTDLRYKELGLLISARKVGLPISLRQTDSVKHGRYISVITVVIKNNTGVGDTHIVQILY